MIGFIKGKVEHKGSGYLIVETMGVGYKVFVGPGILMRVHAGDSVSFVIYTHVREDQITLYGFDTLPEKEFFELLLTVSGVGPKSAVGIMSLASLDMIKSAIGSGDASVFTKVSGIGRKTAERVIIELKDKMKDIEGAIPVAKEHSDALDAMMGLGYTHQEAREALKSLPANVTDLQEKIKLALKNLNK